MNTFFLIIKALIKFKVSTTLVRTYNKQNVV